MLTLFIRISGTLLLAGAAFIPYLIVRMLVADYQQSRAAIWLLVFSEALLCAIFLRGFLSYRINFGLVQLIAAMLCFAGWYLSKMLAA